MRRAVLWPVAVANAVLLILISGCGGDEKPVTIPPFNTTNVELRVDQTFDLSVNLSRSPTSELAVDITVPSEFQNTLEFRPSRLTFLPGDVVKTVVVTGKGSTGGQFVGVEFSIPGTTLSQFWRVKVEDPSS